MLTCRIDPQFDVGVEVSLGKCIGDGNRKCGVGTAVCDVEDAGVARASNRQLPQQEFTDPGFDVALSVRFLFPVGLNRRAFIQPGSLDDPLRDAFAVDDFDLGGHVTRQHRQQLADHRIG